MPRAAKPFFILVAHGLLGVMGHMAALELSPQGGRVQSHEARGSTRALSCGEMRFEAKGHVTELELTSTMR
jgi:hypothetical protein